MLRSALISLAALAMLAACASPQQQQRTRMAQMASSTLDRMDALTPRADPGLVAAADIAFARAARDTDLLSAMREYAADGAVRHAGSGVLDLATSLVGHAVPHKAERWAPNSVWSSCDGRLAVSFGKFLRPDGIVGTYAALWQRQRDRARPYKWTYRLAAKDAKQPAPRPAGDERELADVIVVEALTAINARAADCAASAGASPPPPPPPAPPREFAAGSAHQTGLSQDGTLSWAWEHRADGTRVFGAHYLRDGVWEEVVNLIVTEAGVASP